MGDFLREVFGGSKQKQQSTSDPVDVTPPEVEQLRGTFADTLGSLLGAPGGSNPLIGIPGDPNTVDGVQQTAPVTSQEQQLLQLISGTAQDPTRANLIKQTQEGQFLPGGAQGNPLIQQAIEAAQRPTLEGLQEVLGRTLPGRFAIGGQQTNQGESSAFDRAAAIATRGVSQSLADIATTISFGAQEAERGRQQQGVTLGQQELTVGVEALQVNALPRLIDQFGITEGTKQFQLRIQAVLEALQIATGTPLQTVGQEQQSTGSQVSSTGIVPALAGTAFLPKVSFTGKV